MARYIMVLRGIGRGGPCEIETFLGPEMARAKRVPFGPNYIFLSKSCYAVFLVYILTKSGEK
jgi:hypothetical protein